jgi:histidyl-tRNA synthetase
MRQDNLCPDCQVRLVKNPLRLLDCKVEDKALADAAPKANDYLCGDCRTPKDRLLDLLEIK